MYASQNIFLLRKIPLPCPHYNYMLAGANINDQTRIFLVESLIRVMY